MSSEIKLLVHNKIVLKKKQNKTSNMIIAFQNSFYYIHLLQVLSFRCITLNLKVHAGSEAVDINKRVYKWKFCYN